MPILPIAWRRYAGAQNSSRRVIARQGEAATSMHFILEGRVGVIVDQEDGRAVRVRSLGRQTTIGEMGLIAQKPAQRHHPGGSRQRPL